jgi:putative two-component system hydrogenase maturation factor HypX/HoxX
MDILLLASGFNCLSQRVHAELRDRGHEVRVELALSPQLVADAVARHNPDLIIAPMLTTAIPDEVWSSRTCLIVHPGPLGDRGPSSLDWAIMGGEERWGVTVLEAVADMDAGPIYATEWFTVPACSKSALYRAEVSDAAMCAVLRAVDRFARGVRPRPLDYNDPDVRGGLRPLCRQEDRRIDWQEDSTRTVLAKLWAADSSPGIRDVIGGIPVQLYGGHEEGLLRGDPGEIVAQRDGAICRATKDRAVWIPQLKLREPGDGQPGFKLPAVLALGGLGVLDGVPETRLPLCPPPGYPTYREITYREIDHVGIVEFAFPGGAMSTSQCQRLLTAFRFATSRNTRAIMLAGSRDVYANGVHLNVIEAAADPTGESWANINAIDDLVEAILTQTRHLVIASLAGNAAAGGLMMALAADEVWARSGAVLNPHYKLLGLHGSEFWTFTLPRRVGEEAARQLTEACLPVSAARACAIGLVDRVLACSPAEYREQAEGLAVAMVRDAGEVEKRLAVRREQRIRAEQRKPLAAYRAEELEVMRRNFAGGPGQPYPALRTAFVRKVKPDRTPDHLTRHLAGALVPAATAAAS